MEIIVLGLLVIKQCTIYELHKMITTKFFSMSSNSMGSIQATIKKLREKGMIDVDEQGNKGLTKKCYIITAEGKAYFQRKVSTPMLYKEKNMELGKFFFMGFVEADQRIALIDAYLAELQEQLEELNRIRAANTPRPALDERYLQTLRAQGVSEEVTLENMADIAQFQYATLDLAIDKLQFELAWFKRFKQQYRKEKE